jgi:Tfp pilus assembly protein PilN
MSDINLLKDFYRPKKAITMASYILTGVLAAALFTYFGIFVPLKEKRDLEVMVSSLSQANSQYELIEKEYSELSKQMEELKQKSSGIAPLISDWKLSKVFQLIEDAIPQGVTLYSFSYDGGAVVLQGSARDDVEVARFEVMLVKTGLFSNVEIKRIYGSDGGQSFLINCKLESLD